MLETLTSIWKSKDLRNRIFFTIGVLILIRFIAHIPLPGINTAELQSFLNQSQNQVLGVLSLFTGGSLSKLSIELLGVGPYITASIVVQLLTKAIPQWDALNREGSAGQEKLNQYTRYLAVPMAIIQGYGTLAILQSQNVLSSITTANLIQMMVVITGTTIFVMWLGELISERGIGNGISMIIALGIIAGLPQQITNTSTTLQAGGYFDIFLVIALLLVSLVVIVVVNDAERKIPITYARRAVGQGSAVNSYLPIRVNTAGVVPIIFALSFLTFPAVIARFFTTAKSHAIVNFANKVTALINNQTFYGITYFILVLIFTFFYTYFVFQPDQIAENLQQQGGFVPGVRPGSETVTFLNYIITRLTVIGAIFLALIAILPLIIQNVLNVTTLTLGGTSILIVVSVIIETSRQLNSLIIMHRYDSV